MTPGSLVTILNPAAANGGCARRAREVLSGLRKAGLSLEVHRTASPGDATRIARKRWRAGARRFLAVGGDGTVYEVLNGIAPEALNPSSSPRTAIGILPLGTGNSFVRDFSRDTVDYAVAALLDGRRRPTDILRVRYEGDTVYALGVVSLAFPAHVSALVNRRLKAFGRIGYSLGVLGELARLEPLSIGIALDGRPLRRESVTLLSLNNNRFVGGNMEMSPTSRIDDGQAELITVEPVARLELLRAFPRIFGGAHISHPAVTVRQARQFEFGLAGPADVMVDGESFRRDLRHVEVVPAAIDVLL